ncbi:MAG: flagellar basal body L-ring protein FlgH [Pseudomonadota bacterium]
MTKSITPSIIALFIISACASNDEPAPPVGIQGNYVPIPAAANIVQQYEHPGMSSSLWSTDPNALLSMRRATAVGDLLTVVVNMNDQANLRNTLLRTRQASEDVTLNAFLGLPEWAETFLPGGSTLSPAIDVERESQLNGIGTINRAEQVVFRLAARVVGIEPNGNLIVQGYQQTQISGEMRYLSIAGVIRAQDITRDNTVTYDRIADAQIAYVNNGEATGAMKRNLIPRAIDTVLPF